MPDLISIITNGASSLSVHKAATATASHNIQNANTPGYARQRAELGAMLPAETMAQGQIGRGVNLLGITQARDKFIERQLPGALSSEARSSAEATVLKSVNALDPDASGGITAALGQFYSAMRALSQNPSEPGSRSAVVSAGRALGFAFNRTAGSIRSAQEGVDAQMVGLVANVNESASAVARLNREIKAARTGNSEPNDLLDARQKHLDRLSQMVGAKTVPNGSGDVTVVLPGGMSLVNGQESATLSTRANPANGGLLEITISPVDGSSAQVISTGRIGGTAAGLLDARDGGLGQALSKLDQLAYDFSASVNNVHQTGYGLDGTTGQDFFAPVAGVQGAAMALAVDTAVQGNPRLIAASSSAATLPGDGLNLQAMIATERQVLSSGGDVGQGFGRLAAEFGAAAAGADAIAEQDSQILGHLSDLRESVSGVSIDEELVNLTKSQRAYEAVMKVISTADGLLDTLMKLR
jgi:flagellar hook-associated protein 1 FlgK